MRGTVAVLRRYPVKSMLGEDIEESDVSRTGVARDRRLAVVSRRTGKVASAKYPRLWRDLLSLSAEAAPIPSGSRFPTAGRSAAPTRTSTRSCPRCLTSPSR